MGQVRDQHLADAQAAAHVAFLVAEPMCYEARLFPELEYTFT